MDYFDADDLVEDRGGKTWISTYAVVYDVWCSDYIRVCPSCFKNCIWKEAVNVLKVCGSFLR